MESSIGVISFGLKLPIMKKGDDLVNEVFNAVCHSGMPVDDNDVIGVTESIVARVQGNYVTVDEIADEVRSAYGDGARIGLIRPIYSRNRFSMILKGIARGVKEIVMFAPDFDEVGNPSGVNPFTGCDILKYYADICASEACEFSFERSYGSFLARFADGSRKFLYCGLHDSKTGNVYKNFATEGYYFDLSDICSDKCEYGLLGSNKATEEMLKLFPKTDSAKQFCYDLKDMIYKKYGKKVIVCVYGDGCFKDPIGGIWEFADPVTMPAFTDEDIMLSTPNEIKIKAFADDQFGGIKDPDLLTKCIKEEIKTKENNLVGNMSAQGTTPRLRRDLLASLMDLTSGSGDKGTPVVVVKNYFSNYAD